MSKDSNSMKKKEKYEKIKEIGTGSYGTVFEVERVEDGKKFALKVSKNTKKGSIADLFNDCMKEAELVKTLKHPNIILFEDSFISENKVLEFNIVTELAEGGDLYKRNEDDPLDY